MVLCPNHIKAGGHEGGDLSAPSGKSLSDNIACSHKIDPSAVVGLKAESIHNKSNSDDLKS